MAPIAMERRRLALAATLVLKYLGHSGFSRLLLELGVPEDVGTGGGLLARANSLGRYVLSNPGAKTFNGTLLADALIERAKEAHERGLAHTANVTEAERQEFEAALAADATGRTPPASHTGAQDVEPESPTAPSPIVEPPERRPARRKVFIVHGHDEGAREAIARFLQKTEFEPVILHERPNRGRTIITKFQQEASDVGFAVVLMTPDDEGGKAGGPPRSRARQNVVFELGFFIGALGPERVAALVKGDIERPSDFEGVVYIPLDENGAWRQVLGRELEAAGFTIDWNKAMQS
jgi:Predicted nucleotide-binding protein containing TIR-like domain